MSSLLCSSSLKYWNFTNINWSFILIIKILKLIFFRQNLIFVHYNTKIKHSKRIYCCSVFKKIKSQICSLRSKPSTSSSRFSSTSSYKLSSFYKLSSLYCDITQIRICWDITICMHNHYPRNLICSLMNAIYNSISHCINRSPLINTHFHTQIFETIFLFKIRILKNSRNLTHRIRRPCSFRGFFFWTIFLLIELSNLLWDIIFSTIILGNNILNQSRNSILSLL